MVVSTEEEYEAFNEQKTVAMALNNCAEAEIVALGSVSVAEEINVTADAHKVEEEGLSLRRFRNHDVEGTI